MPLWAGVESLRFRGCGWEWALLDGVLGLVLYIGTVAVSHLDIRASGMISFLSSHTLRLRIHGLLWTCLVGKIR